MATKPRTKSSAGTRFAMAIGEPATYDEDGFKAQTYKNIGKIKNGGEIGETFEVIKNQYLSQRGAEKRKGTFDAGQLTLELDRIDDEGQALAKQALRSDDDFSVRITLQDGSGFYLRGIVTKFVDKVGGPNDMYSGTLTVDLNPIFLADGAEVAAIEFEPPAPPAGP